MIFTSSFIRDDNLNLLIVGEQTKHDGSEDVNWLQATVVMNECFHQNSDYRIQMHIENHVCKATGRFENSVFSF